MTYLSTLSGLTIADVSLVRFDMAQTLVILSRIGVIVQTRPAEIAQNAFADTVISVIIAE